MPAEVEHLYRVTAGVIADPPPTSTTEVFPGLRLVHVEHLVAQRDRLARIAARFEARSQPWWGEHWVPVLHRNGISPIVVDAAAPRAVWAFRTTHGDRHRPAGGDRWVRPLAECLADYLWWGLSWTKRLPIVIDSDGRLVDTSDSSITFLAT